MNLRGAIDLGALNNVRKTQAAAAAPSAGVSPFIKDVTAESFENDVIKQSMTVPVVVDLWAEWCGPCKQLSPVLEKLAVDYNGRIILAKIDIEAEQQLAAAFQVQSIPMVLAFVGGQPLGLFQGAVPEQQAREVIDQVLAAAAQAGVNGVAEGAIVTDDIAPEVEVPSDPRFDAAESALEAGDWDAAIAAYKEVLKATPADAIARIGLLNAELMKRTDGMDFDAALAAQPSDVESSLAAADALFILNKYSESFAVLIAAIKVHVDSRDVLRQRLLELFDIAGPTDPDVTKARTALANALF